ncbi:hypothetical protein CLCR_04403 [Cladophialophora carrionii]|uniref:Uncharacterized protein n=1 Tax=Cladophialophora carrionii TaxID=86049 RepID=A0A1C1CIU3_9EURO|nr:hypothetical protein CLCR_04403 [Cladophialophora carrionii]
MNVHMNVARQLQLTRYFGAKTRLGHSWELSPPFGFMQAPGTKGTEDVVRKQLTHLTLFEMTIDSHEEVRLIQWTSSTIFPQPPLQAPGMENVPTGSLADKVFRLETFQTDAAIEQQVR